MKMAIEKQSFSKGKRMYSQIYKQINTSSLPLDRSR